MGGMFGDGQTIASSEQRLGAMRVQTSAYGYPIPIIYGTTRVTVNLIWYGDFVAIPHTSTQSSGGKGGGEITSSNTTYTYQCAVMMALGEGPIALIGTVWATKKITDMVSLGLGLSAGTYPQTPWGYLTTYHPTQALGYQGVAAVWSGGYQLGTSAELPNHSFEVGGRLRYGVFGVIDANPKDVITDFLTNVNYGACPLGFPLGSMTQYSNYCIASGLFISPAIKEQRPASEYITELLVMTNSEAVYSEGVLKIVPYGDTTITGGVATYVPNITPIYDLTDDDFIGNSSSDPIVVSRKTTADAYNQVQIEFVNRANQYNVEIAEAKDQSNIEQYGLRPMDPLKMHGICVASIARMVAQMKLQRELYIRNLYDFRLGWRYCLLEPMDIVTLTDVGLNLNKFQVRIVSIEEDEDGELAVTAEEFPFGVAHPALYSYETAGGYSINYNTPATSTGAPIIFEAPIDLAGNTLQVWLGVAALGNWGGCNVWISSDDVTYRQIGSIKGGARMGVLSAALPAGGDPDFANTCQADLTSSAGVLLSGTTSEANNLRTLCYIDKELLSYQTATLFATNRYNLTYLRRNAYRSGNSIHAIGAKFMRLDDAIFKYQYTQDQIGKSLYFKFPAFNVYGGGQQALSAATAYPYTLAGPPVPPNVDSFLVNVQPDGTRQFTWSMTNSPFSVAGFRIRYLPGTGATWDAMLPLHTNLRKASPYETNQLTKGAYTFAIKSEDSAGTLSFDALYINLTIPDPRLAGVLGIVDSYASNWPGTKTDCHVEKESGYLKANDSTTWTTLPATWTGWTRWCVAPISPIVYEEMTDLGVVAAFTPLISVTGDGTATVTESHSNDNITWSAYAATGVMISCRYIKIKISMAGVYPVLKTAVMIMDAKPLSEDINDLNTAALVGAYRIAVGDIRLPIKKSYAVIRKVQVTLQSVGAGWTWVLIDKDITVGPRIKIYNAAGALADATIDANIGGL